MGEEDDYQEPGVTWEEGENLDYRTLAKAGGRKDLLYHIEKEKDPNVKAATWPKSVEWFEHPVIPKRKASAYKSPLKNHWSQWNTDIVRLPPITTESPQLGACMEQKRRGKAAPAHVVTQRDAVDFSRLLSQDYQREWLERRNVREERQKRVTKEKKEMQRKKLLDHSRRARQILMPTESSQKEPFVMKRFTGIPAKVKLPPL